MPKRENTARKKPIIPKNTSSNVKKRYLKNIIIGLKLRKRKATPQLS
ncbi:MAG: hypothetical protein HZB67_05070 [Candidatus Aenigmarchaeota archaeon]|nr:hypothetical protein [Candidatus Aenigmarchaeota archaeon]